MSAGEQHRWQLPRDAVELARGQFECGGSGLTDFISLQKALGRRASRYVDESMVTELWQRVRNENERQQLKTMTRMGA